jgi:hypothetical protein
MQPITNEVTDYNFTFQQPIQPTQELNEVARTLAKHPSEKRGPPKSKSKPVINDQRGNHSFTDYLMRVYVAKTEHNSPEHATE